MGAPTISQTNRNTFSLPCMVVDRFNMLHYLDGTARGLVWDGTWPTTMNAGIDKPQPPSTGPDAGGGSLTQDGVYYCAYRYLDKNLQPGDLSTFDDVTGPGGDPTWRIDWALAASADPRIKWVELWRSTAGVPATVYLLIRLGNNGAITSITDSPATPGFCRITGTLAHGLHAGATILVAGASVPGYNAVHTVLTEISDFVVDTDIVYSSNATTATWTLTGYVNDGTSDNSLIASNESMQILNTDGTFNARRFGVPPSYKSVMIIFQDRAIYGVDIYYTAGTVAGTAGSVNLTGTSVNWTTDMLGRQIIIDGESEPFTIDLVPTASTITLSKPLTANRSGASYTITSPRDFLDTLIYSETDEPESVPIDPVLGYVNTIKVQKNTSDIADRETGLMPLGGNFYSLRERHIYRINFTRQPDIDAAINLVASRGCVNNRCWAQLAEWAYFLDDIGIYRFAGAGAPQAIGERIQTYWRDALIDWTAKKWFFVAADRQLGVIKFFLRLTGDSGTRPRRAFCYDVNHDTWWEETYPWDIGHACQALIAGQVRMLVGSDNDLIYKTNDGYTDAGTPFSWSWKSGQFVFLVEEDQETALVEVVFPPTTAAESFICQTFVDQSSSGQVARSDNRDNQNAVMVAGSAGVAVDMQRTRDAKGDQAGVARWQIGKRNDERAMNGLYLQLSITGTQVAETVAIYSIAIAGVQ